MSNINTKVASQTKTGIYIGLSALVVLVFGFGFWAVKTQIAGAVVAPGRLEVEQNRQVIQHRDGGIVHEVYVSEGETVNQGDVLLRLDDNQLSTDFSIVNDQLHQIQVRRARLQAERDNLEKINLPTTLINAASQNPSITAMINGEQNLFEARRETFSKTINRLEEQRRQIMAQINGIKAQAMAMKRQTELISKEVSNQKKLFEKGLSQATLLSTLQREEAGMIGQAGELAASLAQTQSHATEIEVEILRIKAERRERANTELREVESQQSELLERKNALATRLGRLDIRAPVSGRLLALTVTTPNSVLRPADVIGYIIPQDRPLIISVKVDPIHIDEVYEGQEARLVFSALPQRTTPELYGKISLVSADVVQDPSTQLPYYKVEISMSPGEIAKLKAGVMPGMPVEAFIQTSLRTPLSYLLQPFTDYFVRAFRES